MPSLCLLFCLLFCFITACIMFSFLCLIRFCSAFVMPTWWLEGRSQPPLYRFRSWQLSQFHAWCTGVYTATWSPGWIMPWSRGCFTNAGVDGRNLTEIGLVLSFIRFSNIAEEKNFSFLFLHIFIECNQESWKKICCHPTLYGVSVINSQYILSHRPN